MTDANDLREKVTCAISLPLLTTPDAERAADAAIRIVAEHCAEIAVSYDWLGERRAAGIGRFGSGVDEGLFAEGADHAAAEIARNIRALIPKETTDD